VNGLTQRQIVIGIALILAVCLVSLLIGWLFGRHGLEKIVRRRLSQSRAVIGGQVAEQMAPVLKGFPYNPGDCRFIGKPIDYIVFNGMDEQQIDEVIFLEIKTGKSQLSDQEKHLRDAVKAGKVRWQELRL
jgi:predicted Holliday junction resolvase-like endonuclease